MNHATVDRREFLKTGAAAGATLVLGLYLPAFDPRGAHAATAPEPFKPNAWIEIGPDGAVTIWTGMVEHMPTGRRLGYGDLAARAATLAVPADPPLKSPSEFRLLGASMPRVDTPDKVSGAAVFGMDVRVPGMVYAAVARCPVFG